MLSVAILVVNRFMRRASANRVLNIFRKILRDLLASCRYLLFSQSNKALHIPLTNMEILCPEISPADFPCVPLPATGLYFGTRFSDRM